MLKQTHAHRHRHTHTHTVGEVTMFQLRSTDYTKTHNKVKYVCIGIQINARIHSKKRKRYRNQRSTRSCTDRKHIHKDVSKL